MRNVALAGVLGVGLAVSAAVTLTPVGARAQADSDMEQGAGDMNGGHEMDGTRDLDDRGVYRDYRDRDDRVLVGPGPVGLRAVRPGPIGPGIAVYPYYYPYYYPYFSGYYLDPYNYDPYSIAAPYCSSYDYDYGFCSF